MKMLANVLISIQTILWDINLSRKAKRTDLKRLTQLQQPLWRMNRPVQEVIEVLSVIYSWLEKKEKCLILSIVTASALIHFANIEECDIVIAVKQFYFGAHAWVELDEKTIPPSEVMMDYREMIRIRFDKNGAAVVPQNVSQSQ